MSRRPIAWLASAVMTMACGRLGFDPPVDPISAVDGGGDASVCTDPVLDPDCDGLRTFPWGPDVDGDGDGAVQYGFGGTDYDDNNPAVQTNAGTGTFTPFMTYPLEAGAAPTGIVTADFDNDGVLDLATTNQNTSSISVYLGAGDGTFALSQTIAGGGGGNIAAGDLDGDGNLDIAGARNIVVYGLGDGRFVQAPNVFLNDNVNKMHIADVNNDGLLDIIGAGGANISVALSTPAGGFLPTVRSPVTGINAFSIAFIDGDDRLDVACVANQAAQTNLGQGDGSFQPYSAANLAGFPGPLGLGDLNGDGDPDIVVGDALNPTINVVLSDGTGLLGLPTPSSAPSSPSGILLVDFNGDGKRDLAMAAQSTGLDTAIGNGDGTFGAISSMELGFNEFALTSGDFNRDGKLDLAVANISSNDFVVLLGD